MRTLAAILLTVGMTFAAVWYVSPSGDSTNPGTLAEPFASIQQGLDSAVAGDRVRLDSGVYTEEVRFPRSGTALAPIVLTGDTNAGGEPLAVIDNTTPVGGEFWTLASEKGVGVYKKLGFNPTVMTWKGDQIIKIHQSRMEGDTSNIGYTGFDLLDMDSAASWSPSSAPGLTTPFWQDVEAIYGVLDDTCYIRFQGRAQNPDTCDLRANESESAAISLDSISYVRIEYLQIQGAPSGISMDSSSNNVVSHCVIKNGSSRLNIGKNSANNTVAHNDFSLGYGSYGQFGEWGTTGLYARRAAMYDLAKWIEGYSVSADLGVVVGECGVGNQIDSNYFHSGNIGVYTWKTYFLSIFGNTFENFSSIGIYSGFETESLKVYDNDINHCNLAIRVGDIGGANDTLRNGWFYNNRACADSGQGAFIRFHAGGDETTAASFWFYHNSYAGGMEFAAITPLCSKMRFVNNIWSPKYFSASGVPIYDTFSYSTAGFDYNFLGGRFSERYCAWAGVDRHNQWPVDTIAGDINHQVWPLKVWSDSAPDFAVPDTSTAYHAGLPLCDSFELRDSTYAALPGVPWPQYPQPSETAHISLVSFVGNLAYCGSGDSLLHILDVSDPALPVEVGSCTTWKNPEWEAMVQSVVGDGNYAYAAMGNDLAVFDVSDSSAPVQISEVYLPGWNVGVIKRDTICYVAAYTEGINVVNVADPENPVKIGEFDDAYGALGLTMFGDTLLCVSSGAGTELDGVWIFNVADPANPTQLAFMPLYITESIDSADATHIVVADGSWMRIIDISNPAAPVQTDSIRTEGYCFGVAAGEGYAYCTDGLYLYAIDISDPTDITTVGTYTSPATDYTNYGIRLIGDDLYLLSGSAAVGEPMVTRAIDVSDPTNPVAEQLSLGSWGSSTVEETPEPEPESNRVIMQGGSAMWMGH